jgi:hypothetical protein
MDDIHKKHPNFFDASETTVRSYVDENNGEISFKPGLIPDIKVYEDIKRTFQINDLTCDATYLDNRLV